jgi:23S rRNA pseudouridine2605 synthase
LHPIGRLDFNTEGLLILTNDGELTNFITSAKNHVEKSYEAKVKGIPPDSAVERLRRGILIEEGVKTRPAKIERLGDTDNNAWFRINLTEGRNQQIRKMFDAIGHSVVKLRRTQIGHLRDDKLPVGSWRLLSPAEIKRFTDPNRGTKPAKQSPKKQNAPKAKKSAAGHGSRRG